MAGALKARTSVGPDVWTVIGYAGMDQATADALYLKLVGGLLTGRLTIGQTTTVPLRLLSGSAGSASVYFRDITDVTNNARITALDSGGMALATERTDEPIKLMVNNVDKLTVGATLLTAGVPVALPGDPASSLHAATKGYVDTRAGVYLSINTQSGASYTLALSDIGLLVQFTSATAVTVTVPTNATVPFPIGTRIDLLQTAAGKVTVSPTGITLNATPTAALRTQWSSATLIKRNTDTWTLVGDLG
jgi:hypothetical protein